MTVGSSVDSGRVLIASSNCALPFIISVTRESSDRGTGGLARRTRALAALAKGRPGFSF